MKIRLSLLRCSGMQPCALLIRAREEMELGTFHGLLVCLLPERLIKLRGS
jgi:hypothetical protein